MKKNNSSLVESILAEVKRFWSMSKDDTIFKIYSQKLLRSEDSQIGKEVLIFRLRKLIYGTEE